MHRTTTATDQLLESPKPYHLKSLVPSSIRKTCFISSKVLMGSVFSASKGAAMGYICGFGIGHTINVLLAKLPGYEDDPELSILVAKIFCVTGASMLVVSGLARSLLHSVDDQLSLRAFLIEVLR
jgi:hypothetical protein